MKFLIAIMSLVSLEAFAHPTDSGLLTELGVGTQLEIIRDINIPASQTGRLLGDMKSEPGASHVYKSCSLFLAASPRDRVIKAGTVYTIQGITKEYYGGGGPRDFGERYSLTINSASVDLQCVAIFARLKDRMIIGDFKSITRDSFKVILAEPEIIQ